MARTPHARYSQADHPVMRQMLGPERAAALERTLSLIEVQLARPDLASPSPEGRPRLLEKRSQVEALLRRAGKTR